MLEDVMILSADGTPLKKCARSKADWMLRVGVARLYQAEGPMKIIMKSCEGVESVQTQQVHKYPGDVRHAGVEMNVLLLRSDGKLLKKITKDTASWLLRVGVARVHSAEPYTLIMKAPPAAAQAVLSSPPPTELSPGEAKEPKYPRPRNRLYPVKLFWPNYTPKKETV